MRTVSPVESRNLLPSPELERSSTNSLIRGEMLSSALSAPRIWKSSRTVNALSPSVSARLTRSSASLSTTRTNSLISCSTRPTRDPSTACRAPALPLCERTTSSTSSSPSNTLYSSRGERSNFTSWRMKAAMIGERIGAGSLAPSEPSSKYRIFRKEVAPKRQSCSSGTGELSHVAPPLKSIPCGLRSSFGGRASRARCRSRNTEVTGRGASPVSGSPRRR
mmetsp:Transcript_7693/g.18262  ORF Transcript_7693/g.18262 Transcript_7693/m.18262 type:complete len:221 (-) Transcript_7693:412-1074(-)